jgi:5-methylcytosine-specific restriction enzyme subunit McrC
MPEYNALDCLPFINQNINDSRLLNRLKELCELEINTFFGSTKELKDNPLLYIDNKTGLWTAGRFVGNTNFNVGNGNYKIKIEPRFGKDVLKWLICEITNIRFTPATGKSIKDQDSDTLLILLTYLWLYNLSEANRYGLPRNKIRETYVGDKVRGRLDIRKSIISYRTQKKLVSSYNKKIYDDSVIQLLKFTLEHLKKSNTGFSNLNKSDSAKDAISHLNKVTLSRRRFTHHDFSNIKLGSIYQSYGRIIDLSWNILQNTASNEIIDESNEKTLGTFLDMAEIWEKFLRKVLADKLTKSGWEDKTPGKINTYEGSNLLKQTMIPDIVFEKGDTILVIDAKYKRMVGSRMDIDREDFFQIHTYIHYYEQTDKKVIGGLVYPISGDFSFEKSNTAQKLFGENDKHKYFVDGMRLDFDEKKTKKLEDLLDEQKNQLVERILRITQD